MSDDLLKWRSEFPILDKTVYLISHSLGAMPKATYDRLHDYADAWATRGVRAWAEGWWDMPVTVGDEVATNHRRRSGHRRHASERLDLPVADPLLFRTNAQAKQDRLFRTQLSFGDVRLRSARARREAAN